MPKRKPAPDSKLARILDEGIRAHPDLTQAALARRIGVTQSTISRWKRGEVDPQSENLRRAFEVLGIPLTTLSDQLSEGAPGTLAAGVTGLSTELRRVPLISLVQAGGFGETVDPYQPGDGRDRVLCPVRSGPKTFALTVDGESMEPRYHNGDIIFVDPDVSPVHGSDVVVRLENINEATFKRLVIEGKKRYLKPLNTRFPIIEITAEARIVGVVIAATWTKTRVPSP